MSTLKLRPIVNDDLFKLNKWKNDENIFMYLGGGYSPLSIDQQSKWLDNLIDLTGSNRRFIIEVNGQAIGMAGLYNINWIHRTCEVGLYIGELDYMHKGYASLSYSYLEKYAVDYLNLRKINLKVVSENEHAVKLWEKNGFKKVGNLSKERYIKGKYCDVYIMEKFLDNGGFYDSFEQN